MPCKPPELEPFDLRILWRQRKIGRENRANVEMFNQYVVEEGGACYDGIGGDDPKKICEQAFADFDCPGHRLLATCTRKRRTTNERELAENWQIIIQGDDEGWGRNL